MKRSQYLSIVMSINQPEHFCNPGNKSVREEQILKELNEILSNPNTGALPESHKALVVNIRCKNINRLVFAQLNINSLRNKFESLQHIINKNIDVLLISETKTDSSFPSAQFHLESYATHTDWTEMQMVMASCCI